MTIDNRSNCLVNLFLFARLSLSSLIWIDLNIFGNLYWSGILMRYECVSYGFYDTDGNLTFFI